MNIKTVRYSKLLDKTFEMESYFIIAYNDYIDEIVEDMESHYEIRQYCRTVDEFMEAIYTINYIPSRTEIDFIFEDSHFYNNYDAALDVLRNILYDIAYQKHHEDWEELEIIQEQV